MHAMCGSRWTRVAVALRAAPAMSASTRGTPPPGPARHLPCRVGRVNVNRDDFVGHFHVSRDGILDRAGARSELLQAPPQFDESWCREEDLRAFILDEFLHLRGPGLVAKVREHRGGVE